jgi:hypothetical protein
MSMACSTYGGEERRCIYKVLVGKPEGKGQLGRTGLDGMIILRWIFRKWDVGVWTALGLITIETSGGHL